MTWKALKSPRKLEMNTGENNVLGKEELGMNMKNMWKRIGVKILVLTLMTILFCAGIVNAGTVPMITEWTVPASTTIKLPIPTDSTNNFTVDWGDGTSNSYTTTAFPSHTYTTAGTYTIKITGTVKELGYTGWTKPTSSNSYSNYYTFTQYLTGLIAWGELEATIYGFSYCGNLSSTIPEPTENSFKNIMSFKSLFYYCSGLTGSIPANLFSNCPNVTEFSYVFYNCSGLTGSIPANLFSNCPNVTNFYGVFGYCSGLTGSIPANLFSNCSNVTYFGNVFDSCSGLTGSIPANLFSNCPNAEEFIATFHNCSGLTGSVSAELFSGCPNAEFFVDTFANCIGLTSATIDTRVISAGMFFGCNNLKEITITNRVEEFDSSRVDGYGEFFKYTGTSPSKLITILNTTNEIALNYDWYSDNRIINAKIIKQPEDVTIEFGNNTEFSVEVSGDFFNEEIEYQWYEVSNGKETILTEEGTKIYKSNIEGQSNTITTSNITINTTETSLLSFEYMVSSELGNDKFTITIEDVNGITTVVDGISGEVYWKNYSAEFTPNLSGEIILTLTYSKNESIDSGLDYGAIRNLKFLVKNKKAESNFESDELYTIINTDEMCDFPEGNFITEIVDGEVIFKNGNFSESTGQCGIYINIQKETFISFDYTVKTNENVNPLIYITDGNGENTLVYSEGTAINIDWTNYQGIITPGEYGSGIILIFQNYETDTSIENVLAIKNLYIITDIEETCTFENDATFTINNNEWETISPYSGMNTSTLTISGEGIAPILNGSEYYCSIFRT